MKIIISALHFDWTDIDNCFDRITREFALDGVELSFHECYSHPHCTKEDIASIRRANESYGLFLYAHIWEDIAQLSPRKAVEALRYWAEISVQAGVRGLIIHGGSYPDRNEGIVRTRRALQKVLPEFERANVVLYLENHYAYDYQNCQELFSEVWEFEQVLSLDSPSLRLCFDTGHGNLTGNSEDIIVNLQSHLGHVHLADNHGINDDHCPYKHGTVQWKKILTLLHRGNYDGVFCVEFPVRIDTAPFSQCLNDIKTLYSKKLD